MKLWVDDIRKEPDGGGCSDMEETERIGKYTLKTCRSCNMIRKIPSPNWLRQQRIQAKLTLREMGKRIGVTASYLCDLELGRRTPTARITTGYEALV